MQDTLTLVFSVFMVVVILAGLIGIWDNWIWLGKDGWNLPLHQRPGFFKFWLVIIPRYITGRPTGMEDVTL
jgi:hypothetical protein